MIKVQNRWWMWSGEADLGFWGALRTASVNVVNDKILGEYAYGADLKTDGGTYVITPKDGVRRKAVFYNLGKLGFELSGAKYTKATVAADGKSVTLEHSGRRRVHAHRRPDQPAGKRVEGLRRRLRFRFRRDRRRGACG